MKSKLKIIILILSELRARFFSHKGKLHNDKSNFHNSSIPLINDTLFIGGVQNPR